MITDSFHTECKNTLYKNIYLQKLRSVFEDCIDKENTNLLVSYFTAQYSEFAIHIDKLQDFLTLLKLYKNVLLKRFNEV